MAALLPYDINQAAVGGLGARREKEVGKQIRPLSLEQKGGLFLALMPVFFLSIGCVIELNGDRIQKVHDNQGGE